MAVLIERERREREEMRRRIANARHGDVEAMTMLRAYVTELPNGHPIDPMLVDLAIDVVFGGDNVALREAFVQSLA